MPIFYDYTQNFRLIFIRNCNSFRFLGYILTFSTFDHTEINNRFENLGGGGGDDLEVRTLGGRGTSKAYESAQGGGEVDED